MDLNKLAQELGGKPVTDLDSLASELGGQIASTPGGYGAGTFGKDVGKLVGAGAVKGIAGAPETVQAAGSAAARDTLFAPTEVLNLVADPRRLANKLIGSVGLPPIFETTKEKPLVPAEITEKQRAAVDQTLARGKIPQLRQLTEFGNKISEDIENTVSPEMRLAMAESQPTGNIIKALETGDFSDVSMGKNPTALGLTGQAVKVFGSSAPQFIVAMITKTPTLGAAVGFGQAGAEGIDEARNYVKSMSDEQLAQKSEYFRNLVALGYSTNQAREMTEDKAADTAALAQGTVGALGGAFTSKLIQGGFDKALIGSAKSRLGQIVQGVSKGTLVAGAEGALTEMAEGVATDLSIDKTIVREIGVDSFANLVLGAIGEAAPGAVRGALAKGEKVKGAEAPEVPPTPAITPVTPVAGAPSAVVGEGDFEAEEAPPPAPPAVTPVTPPPAPPAGPEAVAPVTPPPAPPEEGPLKGLTPAEAIIKRLKPEFQEEYFTLRDEAKQIIAKQKELVDQGEDEDSSLSIRLEEILSRFDEFSSDKQYRKPIFTKSPNDPAIEKEALALADELEKAGDAVSSDGLRTNLSNMGGFKDPKKLDYYKGKLLEAQQKAGVAEEMPKETFSTRNFIGDYKADKARFDKFLPTAPQQVQNTIAKSDQYIQALVDKINAAGYKVSDINPTASNELQKLKKKISQIGGTSFRYLLDAQHVARNNRYANPKKVAKDEQDLAEDFAEADKLLGAAPTPVKPAESTELEDYARNTRTDDDRYSLKDIQEAVEKSKKNKKDLLVSMEDFTEKNPERMIPIAEKNGFISINKGGNILAAETAADVERNKNNYNNNPDSYDNQKARALANLKDKEGSITEIKESRGISKEYAEKVYNHFLNYHAKKFDYLRDGEYELWDKLNKEHNDFMARLNAVSKKTKETKKSQAEINRERQAEKKAKTEKAIEVKPKIEDIVSPEVASAIKDIEFQKKLIKANNEKSITEAQFSKVFNLHQSGKTAEADAQLTKILEKKEKKAKTEEEPEEVPEVEIKEVKEFPKETPVSKEYQTALNKSRKATKAFQSAQDGYRKRLINDEEFIAARKRYDEAMAEYDIAYAKEQEKPEPKEVKTTPKKTAPVSSEEEQLIQDAVMFAKAANRTNLDEDKIRDTVENARIKEPETVITKLKGSVESLKNQAKDNLIRLAAEDYREQVGGFIGKDSELVNAIKGGALNIEGKEYAPAFYKAYNINPDKIKKPTVSNEVDAQIVKFDSGIFAGRDANPETYDKAAVQFLESPLTAKIPSKNQEKIEAKPLKDVTPLPIEKKIVVKNKTYEDHKAALSDVTAAEDVRYYLKGIYLDKANNRMMATDGHRGAIINNANFDGAPETTKGKDIVALDNSIIEGQFPDMDRVVPKKHLVKSDIINTKELGDYARGVQKAWRYIASKYNPVILKVGGKDFGFNSDYIVDMSNLFARMGYDTFQASVNENGRLFATSPDNRVQQVVMAMREPSTPFTQYVPGKKAEKKVTKVEVKEEPKAGVAVDDEGEKLSFPLFVDMANKGYKILGFDNSRTYETKGGKKYRTIEKDGVRLAINPGEIIFADPKYPNRSPQLGYGESNQVTWHFIDVDKDQRKQGKATQAIKDFMEVADKNGYTVYGEPAQLEEGGMTAEQLSQFYSKFGFQPSEISKKVIIRNPQITDESRTIDVEATEITPSQIKLLTNQVNKLSDADIAALEEHYGVANYSSDFMKRIREDVVTYINKGADAVDAAIRSIIAKLQAGLLSVAVVFNPATFQTPDFNIPRFIEETRTVSAPAPQRAEMSAVANKAYSITAPAFIKANQAFFIADKPNGKIHLFDTDGKFLKSSDALYGKQAGDILTAEAREKPVGETQDIDKVTPAGVFNLSVNKNPDYTGGYVLRFADDKGDMGGVAIHAVYTGDVKENREAKLASKDPKDKKITFGCINVDTSFFTGNIIPRIDKMENAGVVVIPDAQEQLDLFIKPTTERVSAPAKDIKTAERTRIVGRETPYYNDFTSNIDESYFDKQVVKTREEKVTDYAQARAATRRLTKKVAKYGSDLPLQRELNKLLEVEQDLKNYLDISKPVRNTASDFMARAAKELADESITPEVEAFIRNVFEKNPAILEGLRLSVRTQKAGGRDSGNFNPYTRLVTLWKDGSGVENPRTIRHELTHTLEQMMTPDTKKVLVDQWTRAFERAMKVHTDAASKKYFDAVLDFMENPNKENFDKATNVMPSYEYYQYMNPSEYWAVNAEAMLGAKLGGAWSRFTNSLKKMLEGLKSFFGMNNKFAIHKAIDQILSGDMKRISKDTLVDYLLQGEYKIDFLENVEETDSLLDKHNRPNAPIQSSNPVRDAFMGGYDKSKNTLKKIKEQPLMAASNMVGKADRALTYFRNKNIFFGTGLEEADRARYGGQIRNAHQQAIASVALINAIHSGHVATQVMTEGKLIFDENIQMFVAAKDDKSMANVIRAKAKLVKQLGDQRAANVIQAYFEAKRSRSIINEYLDRTAAYENAKANGVKGDPLAELKKELNNIEIAMQKINMTDEAIEDFIKLDKQYPELKEMMDNWTAVNKNMIDMMEFSKLISKERAETLRNIKDYVPWYRIMDDQVDVHSAPGGTRGMTNVGREKKFKSGEVDRDIDDIVDNMIHNVLTLTRNSIRNYAASRIAVEYGTRKENGKLKVFSTEGSDSDGVRFNIVASGKRIVVQIKDPLVAEAVIGMENIDIPMFNALAYLANGLRRSITTFPAFQLVQLFMDAPTAALVTGLKRPDKVWAGVFTSFYKNLRKDDPIVAKLRNAGFGGYQSSARTPEKQIQMEIGLIGGSWFDKAMKGLDRFGDASDYAQRRSVYLQTLKETGDELLAYMQANNIIDFQKRGSGQLAQGVTRTVAFMNAYAQSIDVLAKGLAGGGLKGLSRSQAFARMGATGIALSAMTLIYCMMVGDDDEYNKLDDQTKMRNIYIPGLDMRLPMHTGASFFFKAIPELIYNAIMKEGTKDEYDKKRLTRALSKAALDSLLGPNITPSGVKPVIEITLNKNFFTGGQVTPKGMEDLAAFRQYNQNTSELGKIISALTGTEKTRLLNPMEADHLIRGLLGTVGAAAMWGTNLLASDRPDPQAKDNPFYGQFIMPDVPRGREDLYYDLKTKTDEAYKTFTDLQKKGRKEEAQQWFKENKPLIQVYGYTSGVEADLKNINGEIRRMSDLPAEKMSSTAKRERITELQNIKMRILKDVNQMRKRAGLDESYF